MMDSVSSATSVMQTSPDTFIKLCLLWTAIHRTNVLPQVCKNVIPEEDVAKLRSQVDLAKVWGSLTSRQRSAYYRPTSRDIDHRENHIRFDYRYTSKSLSILGILGGVVLILLVIAMSTCIRNRRRMILEEQENHAHESFAREILISHMRQLRRIDRSDSQRSSVRRRNDVPPAYDDVVKPGDEEDNSRRQQEQRQQQAASANSSSCTLSSNLTASDSCNSIANPNAVSYFELQEQEPPSYVEALQVEAEARAREADEHVVTIEVKAEGEESEEQGAAKEDKK